MAHEFVDCIHSLPAEDPNSVKCLLGRYGGAPHVNICKQCPVRTSQGLEARKYSKKVSLGTRKRGADRKNDARHNITEGDLQLAKHRAAICEKCEHKKSLTFERNGWPVYSVGCRLCGCAGLSLIRGNCRAGKWTTPNATQPDEIVSIPMPQAQEQLTLRARLSPGDTVMLTAAVRDLHRAYPGRFSISVQTTAPELWENNPNVVIAVPTQLGRTIDMHYPLVNQSNQRPYHFLHGYTQYLESQLGLKIPVTEFKGDIHLSTEERAENNPIEVQFGHAGAFWILVAGGKNDFTAKWWSPDFFQQVVDYFHRRVQFVQCGEQGHWHPELRGCFNLIGKTTIRQFVKLMYHAEGVLCPVTFAMHLAAAVPTRTERLRPCVVVAGGREPPHWEAYPGHQFLHTIGALPCCANGGCWRSRCQLIADGDRKNRENVCERPVQIRSDLRIPQCMAMIKPADVIAAIERFLNGQLS